MDRFKDYVEKNIPGEQGLLVEKLITFGGKAYPKFNNVVILAGGGGSGKGFSLSNLLGIEGKVFDVDELKGLALRSPKVLKKVKDEFGVDLKNISLKKPENVAKVHQILGHELKITDKANEAVYRSIFTAHPERKPNLIFDVTLKTINKLRTISKTLQDLGYKKEDIHIVWVLNSIDVALAQNQDPSRGRVVPQDILIQTHEGVAMTMRKLLDSAKSLVSFMDGDFWINANMRGVDTDIKFSGNAGKKFDNNYTKGGQYITDANYWQVKKKGKAPKKINEFEKELRAKLKKYTPRMSSWD